jgi:TPR repeat protein
MLVEDFIIAAAKRFAAMYYELAASHGNKVALFKLGILYEYGEGVTKNLDRAISYYQKAASHGHGPAKTKLTHLSQKYREHPAFKQPSLPPPSQRFLNMKVQA